MAERFLKFVFVILLGVVMSICEESGEELAAGEDYIQIFRNIPKLFEYLLDTLEKRPEILEDNRYPAFERSTMENGREKRSIHRPCGDRHNTDDTTETHEQGNSIKDIIKPRSVVTVAENDKQVVITEQPKPQNFKAGKDYNNFQGNKLKRFIEKQDDTFMGPMEWAFNLSPEEVEDMAIKVEKEIEDHNAKASK